MDADDMTAFVLGVGHVLRAERERRWRSLAMTGRPLGLSVSVMSRLETGQRRLDMRRFVGLCGMLEVEPVTVIALAQREAFPLGWPGGGR